MPSVLYTPAARADLDSIWDYTVETWGEAQAVRYVREIATACTDALDGKRLSRPIDDIRRGYRKFPVNAHVVFCRIRDNGDLEIVRILHSRMDVERHLR